MPPAEITRAETSERARLLRVRDYDVTLDLTGGPDTFGSTCVIRFDCTEPGAASYADLIAADVAEISLNGTQLDPAGWADGRIALPGLAASNELRVVARCRYSADGTGMHRSVDPADGRIYAYTKFEPAYARTVFANFEQPDLKAVFTTHVTAPAGWTVLSNQPQAGPAVTDGDVATWHFEPTPRLPTYQFEVIAGEYAVVRSSHTTPRGQQIPLGLACRQSLAAHQDPDDLFAVTRAGLDYYTTCSSATTRSASTTRRSCRTSAPARPRARAASCGPTRCCSGPGSPTRCWSCAPACCCTRWRTCGSATWSP